MKRTADSIEEAKSHTSAKTSAKATTRRMHPNSLRNLTIAPFKKGQSGNPGGKPKLDVAAEIARAVIEGNQEAVYKAFVKALQKGNAYAFSVLADRGYGKVKEIVEHQGSVDVDINISEVRSEVEQLLERRRRAKAS